MHSILVAVGIALALGASSQSLAVVRAGVGYSTVTSGRQVPALGLGITYDNKWSASAMFAGARSQAHYVSGIMINVMRTKDWGEFWFGRLEVGFGGGAFHSEKGIYRSIDNDGKLTNLEKDQDNMFGPAFRVAFIPIEHVHVSVEFLMGFGSSLISNAWGDVGLGTIGVEL